MFAGKTFAITGATSGIGKDIAIKLAKKEAKVYVCGRRQDRLKKLSADFPSIKTTCLDLTNWNDAESWINSIHELDGLVNNAGIIKPELCHQITKEALEQTVTTNLIVPIHLTQAFSKRLIDKKRSGNIVNISSVAAIKASPGRMVYSSTKAALNQMTRSAAFELGPHNIRVNAVCPTLINTELAQNFWKEEDIKRLEDRLPLGKIPLTHDIVDATLFFLSDDSKMITGQTLYVDSGLTV